ncbi:MDR family MFS transporter [Halobacillus naozhouensis]|uniref:MDR family MFS transporter n=1 Tax=Halobacillus naozhouensis TaxID=554880 RepID=A0ABY8IX17_9BACI|nr:MDR family MFS transporter [Halobacillus naozhouensis]WFT74792.1 MDR family MFS transporter [Halobacillus naozhouensis]
MESNKRAFWLIICSIFFGNFLAILSITTVTVAFPVVMDEFNANLSTVQWLMAGYLLATGIIAPVVGYLGDQLSYKYLYIIALFGFTLFSLFCGLAWDIQILILFRIIQGVFGGMIIPITLTIIYQTLERHQQSKAMGLWSLASMLAPVIGPTFGGWLVDYFGWSAIFFFNLPIGILGIIIVSRCIPYYRIGTSQSFDFIGFISVVASSSLLLFGFSQVGSWGFGSWKTLLLLGSGIILLGFFIRWELRSKAPLLQLSVFKFSQFTYSLIINCIITASMYIGTLLVPLYLQDVLHLSPMDTGLIMLPGAIAMAAASPVVGNVYDRIGPFKLVFTGASLVVISTALFSSIGLETSAYLIAIYQLIRCIGISLCTVPLTNAGMSAVTRDYSGHASSITNWARQGMASMSIGIFSALVVARSSGYLKSDGTTVTAAISMGISDVFWIGTILAITAIPLTFMLRIKSQAKINSAKPKAANQ